MDPLYPLRKFQRPRLPDEAWRAAKVAPEPEHDDEVAVAGAVPKPPILPPRAAPLVTR